MQYIHMTDLNPLWNLCCGDWTWNTEITGFHPKTVNVTAPLKIVFRSETGYSTSKKEGWDFICYLLRIWLHLIGLGDIICKEK